MRIKYLGPGPWCSINMDGATYRFEKSLEITDPEVIAYFLSPERDGAFAGEDVPAPKVIKANASTCKICGKVCASPIGLQGHLRSHKK